MIRFVRRRAALLLAGTALLVFASNAQAHTRSQSRSSWWIEENGATAVFTVATLEVTRLEAAAMRELGSVYALHVADTVTVRSDAGVCGRVGEPLVLPAEPGFARVEVQYRCDDDVVRELEITSFLGVAPSHLHMADVRLGEGPSTDYLFSDAVRVRRIAEAGDEVRSVGPDHASGFTEYVRVGIEHIAAGADHLAFVAILLLLCSGLREVATAITGFTLGHCVTLAAAVLGWLEPNVGAVEALIGYTIAVAALECSITDAQTAAGAAAAAVVVGMVAVVCALGVGDAGVAWACSGLALFSGCYLLRAGGVGSTATARIVLTTVFGLIHGLGFASPLLEMELTTERTVAALAGFNVGVEVGQLAVVALILAAAKIAQRAFDPGIRSVVRSLVCSGLCALGVFWLISRSVG